MESLLFLYIIKRVKTVVEKNYSQIFRQGFTFVELLIVIVILLLAAMLAAPMFTSAADMQLRSAANMIAADLEYAKNMAIGQQQNYTLVFDVAGDSYEICDSDGSVIQHPLLIGNLFEVNFRNDNRLNRVNITNANFDSSQSITFDYLGSPYSGSGTTAPLNDGEIVLSADTFSMTVTVEPVTGYISIQE